MNLDLPGAVLEAPLLVPEGSLPRLLPEELSIRVWQTIALPFFCLPMWWLVGRGIDGLLTRRRLHWALLVAGSILTCGCVAMVIGILTSPPSDKRDLLVFLPGAILWTFAFGVLPLNFVPRWRARRVTPVPGAVE